MTTLHAMSAADVAREIVALMERMDDTPHDSRQHQEAADRWCTLEDALSHCRAETPADALALLAGILNRASCMIECEDDKERTLRRLRCIERSALAVARIIERSTSDRLADFGEFGYLTRTTGAATASAE